MNWLGHILAGLGYIGIISEGIYSATLTTSKLNSTDWGLRIFTPTIISLVLIFSGMYMIFNNNLLGGIDEPMFIQLIIFMAAGNIALASLTIIFSEYVVNWKSD